MEQRVIKFRVWHHSDNEMRTHDWLYAAGVIYPALFDPNRKDITVMQFTGLHDKEGVEIYEKDLFEEDGEIMEVFWHDEMCAFCIGIQDGEGGIECNSWELLDKYDFKHRHRIGNVFTKP